MENSEVLDAQEVNTPREDTQETQDNSVNDTVINSMYQEAQRPTKVTGMVGENNHAESIANNALSHEDAEKTFNYNQKDEVSYKETVDTTTTQSTGANMSATWTAENKMDDKYQAREGEDFWWNKLAGEMASLKYAQEVNQARYESMQARQEINEAASKAWNSYFGAEYAARQTQEKMGWTGGQQQASDLQVAFLQAETAANMYTKEEMQKYGVDTKLGIARMYAEAEQNALALQYYQDAVDQSIKEAEQTGWYIPAEASEMFKQDQVAKDILNDPTATETQKKRAEQVLANTQAYYDARGFQHGYAYDDKGNVVTEYYGIKCLQTLQYEETKRNNKVNEDLQRQANNIAQQQANAAWDQVRLQEISNRYLYYQTNAANTKDAQDEVFRNQASEKTWNGGTYTVEEAHWDEKTHKMVTEQKTMSAEGMKVIQRQDGNYVTWTDDTGSPQMAKVTGGQAYQVASQYYRGDMPAQTQKDADKYGTFSNNYQPKGIEGHGSLSKSGETTTFDTVDLNGNKQKVTQNIWKAEDGTKWVWDGKTLQYNQVKK